jgi:cobalt-zinc-cadmium efflux system protein
MAIPLHGGTSTAQAARATTAPDTTVTTALVASIALNLLLMTLQVMAGTAAHSSGMLADALHSGIDLLADALILLACRIDARMRIDDLAGVKARCEPFALVGLGIVLFGTGAGMTWNAVLRFGVAPIVHPDGVTVGVLLFTLASKEGMFRWMSRVARRVESALLMANAWHVRADAWSSLFATLAIGGTLAGFARLDDIAAAIIGLMIVKTGIESGKRGIEALRAQWRVMTVLRRARDRRVTTRTVSGTTNVADAFNVIATPPLARAAVGTDSVEREAQSF